VKVVLDIECNRLKDPDKVWVIVCKDIDTGEVNVFRDKETFTSFADGVSLWIGHNLLGYDYPVLLNLGYLSPLDVASSTIDTLIISKMADFSREKHSIEDYGREFNLPKGEFNDWSQYSEEMESYCRRDVDICHLIFNKYRRYISNIDNKSAIALEHKFQLVCNQLHKNGFFFNVKKAEELLVKVQGELGKLDKDILSAFPPTEELVRKVRKNKDGSINRMDARYLDLAISNNVTVREQSGDLFLFRNREFNPSSHKQIVEVLSSAGWQPTDKTKTHIEFLRSRVRDKEKQDRLNKYGWKVNETNLLSLPHSAPSAAKTLANRILYESRRRTLVEWLNLARDDGRIHGEFQGIGAWTHRMAHQKPNTANIPNELDNQGRVKLLGGDLRQLWGAPKGRLLVGCDAEGIQLRIFAHYINDPEFTKEVCDGDPHLLNQRVLGSVCRDRQAAKRFIYALLLGAGIGKLGEILESSQEETMDALERILARYAGFAHLKENVFPTDVKRGWFKALDGRKISIPHVAERPHLVMSGYLQSGEAICMKRATLKWMEKLEQEKIEYILVDLVHDEWQTECPNNMDIAIKIGRAQCDALREVGVELGLNVPLAGSFYNKKKNDYTIGTNWRVTH
jgi:DNA polymerase-1